VRHSACAVLAYSLVPSAVELLQTALTHSDPETVADARRAIESIETRNHNRFYPAYSSWGVSTDDPSQPKRADVDRYIVQYAPELVAPLTAIFGDLYQRVR
jgi:hypothetical protein